MARAVDYWHDFVSEEEAMEAYKEGPFVLVCANGWRLEVEMKGSKCPALPDSSIYNLLDNHCLSHDKTNNKKEAEAVCDWLNTAVKIGWIKLHESGSWVAVNN